MKELYHASRNVLLLYKVIIPMKMVKKFHNVSQQARIVHNDYYYLSQVIPDYIYIYIYKRGRERGRKGEGISLICALYKFSSPSFPLHACIILQTQNPKIPFLVYAA
ncbi:Centromere/kinetochore protein zw10 like [Dendrobium catenatum]|uniref:Centromere/kinetochore protein zw10 like n=1 Tax=Dendrobium catenatum TaxID=906689 RepID=A0A2I0VPB2_9ASPA|nr:Centromere/kinetochore protein zw10 like [Dendrobium catenatum]